MFGKGEGNTSPSLPGGVAAMAHRFEVNIDQNEGRTFEGIGGITSNGMSKLLMDYPEEQREDIFNLLFKPFFGASLQHLKVEIGSDVNTSSGTEPGHMRSETDFDITRGYGLVIAKKAKEINPGIYLEALRWGTPRWITDDSKKYKFYINFLSGAREIYGLEFDYLGPDVNEGPFNRDWTVNMLRPGLDRDGFGNVKLVAADSNIGWEIADLVDSDPELDRALHALNIHYIQESCPKAVKSQKPLWVGEDLAPFRHDFACILDVALRIIRMYVLGKMVKYEIHPLIESQYGTVPFSYKGILTAVWPWTGHYEIEPGLWMIAHFTQFIKPGWKYIDSGCGCDEEGGYVTLKQPEKPDYSVIIVNKSGYEKEYVFKFPADLKELYVWKTNSKEQFIMAGPVKPVNNSVRLVAEPYSIYSITNTTGQKKGKPENVIPKETGFPLPYDDDFAGYPFGKLPRFTLDQGGAFETDTDNGKSCITQKITADIKPFDWVYRSTPDPYTLIGSLEWTDYKVCAEVKLGPDAEYAMVCGRLNNTWKNTDPPQGYALYLYNSGDWELKIGARSLGEGKLVNFRQNDWNTVELCFLRHTISAFVNGSLAIRTEDAEISSGQAALGCSYHNVKFANLRILPVESGNTSCRRYDDKDGWLIYIGSWEKEDGDYNNFGRTLRKSNEKGSSVLFRFNGTGFSIIGKKGADCGKAQIFIDGVLETITDLYRDCPEFRKTLFSKHFPEAGEHEVKLVVDESKNPQAGNNYIYIDAVEIMGGKGLCQIVHNSW